MLANVKIALLIEEGTNPTEFNYCRLRLREANALVDTVGLDQMKYRLEDQSSGYADIKISQLDIDAYDAVILPGGLGPEKLRLDSKVLELVKHIHHQGKVCAAICHGQLVLISAGVMRGVHATAAWSMKDDLRFVGAIVSDGERVVRDKNIITAAFVDDLPEFLRTILHAVAKQTGRSLPKGYPNRLTGRRWGIVVDDASDAVQVNYLHLRIREEGGIPILIGRRAGQEVRLSSPDWEWGDMGLRMRVERALPEPCVIDSCDAEAELNSHAISAGQLDGLLLPGGLATWMIRGHHGLRQVIGEMNAAGKPVCAIERGAKVLMSAGILNGRKMTCSPNMRDDVLQATIRVAYVDAPIVLDGNLLTGRGTEELPEFVDQMITSYGNATV